MADSAELVLEEVSGGLFTTALLRDGKRTILQPATSPAEALIAATEIDYTAYRRAVERLWEEHPLFEERRDIPVADFADFRTQAFRLRPMLEELDPVSYGVLDIYFQQCLLSKDDGSASTLLRMGHQLLDVLREPFRVQAILRNIFEVTFDGTERLTQRERFQRFRSVYPDLARHCDPARMQGAPTSGRSLSAYNLPGLRFAELALYFCQSRQRITRCEYCWGYFIPKTQKVTRYCDRVTDGFPCKKRGARFQRNESGQQDEALRVCKQLRDRMYARYIRYRDAGPEERGNLYPMDIFGYDAWSENARLARIDYQAGRLTAEEFLRRIDTTHELPSYEVAELAQLGPSLWQREVAGNWAYDPAIALPEEFMLLDLGKDKEAQWETHTADDLRRYMQRGHQSLREKYGRDK